jgi:transcription initiation factor TFIIIB Brf1 subunit/transcription initiation factor TFIIB
MTNLDDGEANAEPCPFCGIAPTIHRDEYGCEIVCDGCGCGSGFSHGYTDAELVVRWNADIREFMEARS